MLPSCLLYLIVLALNACASHLKKESFELAKRSPKSLYSVPRSDFNKRGVFDFLKSNRKKKVMNGESLGNDFAGSNRDTRDPLYSSSNEDLENLVNYVEKQINKPLECDSSTVSTCHPENNKIQISTLAVASSSKIDFSEVNVPASLSFNGQPETQLPFKDKMPTSFSQPAATTPLSYASSSQPSNDAVAKPTPSPASRSAITQAPSTVVDIIHSQTPIQELDVSDQDLQHQLENRPSIEPEFGNNELTENVYSNLKDFYDVNDIVNERKTNFGSNIPNGEEDYDYIYIPEDEIKGLDFSYTYQKGYYDALKDLGMEKEVDFYYEPVDDNGHHEKMAPADHDGKATDPGNLLDAEFIDRHAESNIMEKYLMDKNSLRDSDKATTRKDSQPGSVSGRQPTAIKDHQPQAGSNGLIFVDRTKHAFDGNLNNGTAKSTDAAFQVHQNETDTLIRKDDKSMKNGIASELRGNHGVKTILSGTHPHSPNATINTTESREVVSESDSISQMKEFMDNDNIQGADKETKDGYTGYEDFPNPMRSEEFPSHGSYHDMHRLAIANSNMGSGFSNMGSTLTASLSNLMGSALVVILVSGHLVFLL